MSGWITDRELTLYAANACVMLVDGDPVDLLQPPRAPQGRRQPEARGPLTDADLSLLMTTLERVPLKEGGWTIRGAVEGSKLPLDRVQRLVGDVRAVLAEVDGRELLDRLRRMPGVGRGDLRELEDRFTQIGRCTRDRFITRDAYRQTEQLVMKHRAKLASLVLESVDATKPAPKDPR